LVVHSQAAPDAGRSSTATAGRIAAEAIPLFLITVRSLLRFARYGNGGQSACG
jgi:hypothetical protein